MPVETTDARSLPPWEDPLKHEVDLYIAFDELGNVEASICRDFAIEELRDRGGDHTRVIVMHLKLPRIVEAEASWDVPEDAMEAVTTPGRGG